MEDLAKRLRSRVQLTTDGHKAYLEAVEQSFGCHIDNSMLVKLYGPSPEEEEERYRPAQCIGTQTEVIVGEPEVKHISTSYVEQNLTMRMHMRRFTRLTNAFSKKLDNHVAAVSLRFMYYTFCRIHQTLRISPAMAAGVTDHAWKISEMVELLEAAERQWAIDKNEDSYTPKGPALGHG